MSSSLFAVPVHALPSWDALHERIMRTGLTPCAGASRDDWTGSPVQQERAADKCWDCPVLVLCEQYADVAGETLGVWGGRTQRQRAARRNEPVG